MRRRRPPSAAAAVLLALVVAGCAHMPTAQHALEIERVLPAPFDAVWDAVLRTAAASNGRIIVQDRASGLIVYARADEHSASQVFLQVYLKPHPTEPVTSAYVIPKVSVTGLWVNAARMPQSVLTVRSAYLREFEHEFFVMLERELSRT